MNFSDSRWNERLAGWRLSWRHTARKPSQPPHAVEACARSISKVHTVLSSHIDHKSSLERAGFQSHVVSFGSLFTTFRLPGSLKKRGASKTEMLDDEKCLKFPRLKVAVWQNKCGVPVMRQQIRDAVTPPLKWHFEATEWEKWQLSSGYSRTHDHILRK